MSKGLSIGVLAKETGTRVETIRWYERVGLLAAPARTTGNYRQYQAADLTRLRFIRRARELGFSLDDVRSLLELSVQRGQDCRSVDLLAKRQLDEVDRKLSDLGALRTELARLIEACDGGVVQDCSIIDALGPR